MINIPHYWRVANIIKVFIFIELFAVEDACLMACSVFHQNKATVILYGTWTWNNPKINKHVLYKKFIWKYIFTMSNWHSVPLCSEKGEKCSVKMEPLLLIANIIAMLIYDLGYTM